MKNDNFRIDHWGANMPRIRTRNMRRREYLARQLGAVAALAVLVVLASALAIALFAERGAQ